MKSYNKRMKAIVQRVSQAEVVIRQKIISHIRQGFVIFLGVMKDDTQIDVDKLVDKIVNLRIMADNKGKMNLSIIDTKGEILVVSQFTLCANISGGRRPDFFSAKEPKEAERLYDLFVKKLKEKGLSVKTGVFGNMMEVRIFNDGPVTFIL